MAASMPTLVFIHEPEKACLERLLAQGFAQERAAEITSYLAQSTDLAPEFPLFSQACAARGLVFLPVELDEAADVLAQQDPASTLVWTITDGIAYFHGSAGPALARLFGLRIIGSDDSLYALCQDKFRSGAVLRALGLPVPAAGLVRDGEWIVPPPAAPNGYFVKPNRLGAKIGIWPDSHCRSLEAARDLSRRIFAAYRDEAVVQPYVRGRNVRASFLGLTPETGAEAAGIFFVDSGGDFQTMADSLALYGDTGAAAKAAGSYVEPELRPVADSQPGAAREIRDIAARLINGLGLRDVFSADLRVEEDGTVHLIEFEVCPGLPCFDFRGYCRAQWNLSLHEAVAETARRRLAP